MDYSGLTVMKFRSSAPGRAVNLRTSTHRSCRWARPGCHSLGVGTHLGEEVRCVQSVESMRQAGETIEPARPGGLDECSRALAGAPAEVS